MHQRFEPIGQRRGWNCKRCARDRAKARRAADPEAWLDAKLWTYYRIRLVDYRRMLEWQGGRCAACGRTPEYGNGFGGKEFVIDHDHRCCPGTRRVKRTCGKCVRGLLCTQCNVALGMVNDDLARLRKLVDYLERHQVISSPAPVTTSDSAARNARSNASRLSRKAG